MKSFRFRAALAAFALPLFYAFSAASASATLEMVFGQTQVVQSPVSDCSAKAKAALNGALQNAFEAGDNTAQWLAYGPLDSSNHASATAAIHCYPLTDTSYVATFTCAAQVPPNPETATALCARLESAFGGKAAAITAPRRTSGGSSWH